MNKENQKLSSANLFYGDDQEEISKVVENHARMLYCENSSNLYDDCFWCKKFVEKNIKKMVKIGNGADKISKKEITGVIDYFSKTSSQSTNKKVVIINSLDNLNIEASNAILKFLEEPPENTFIFLISSGIVNVLETIKSRCTTFFIRSKKNDSLTNFMLDNIENINKNEILLWSQKFKKYTKDEIIKMLDDFYNLFIIKKKINLGEVLITSLNKIKKTNNYNLIIENLLILMYEGW